MDNYDYLLVHIVDREIVLTKYKTEDEAKAAMEHDFMETALDQLELDTLEEIEASECGELGTTFAWLNGDEYKYDWFIRKISEIEKENANLSDPKVVGAIVSGCTRKETD